MLALSAYIVNRQRTYSVNVIILASCLLQIRMSVLDEIFVCVDFVVFSNVSVKVNIIVLQSLLNWYDESFTTLSRRRCVYFEISDVGLPVVSLLNRLNS